MATDPATLKIEIRDLSARLDGLGPEPDSLPQFAISTNAVRQNEYLAKRNHIQSDMIRAYAHYTQFLEEASTGLVEIQHQMIELLRLQAKEMGR
ncbi:MAG: hypothetical protein J4G04_05940 [Nitrosopumilaceae archaeon]|nr:hypothetical protein [Nitrosopumilaceae archaeon]